ncbi:MAG TPA: Fic family protein [Hyphomicrobium sp.]|uniref:Fic family protein n=1 Tax=Hyphomicrobium sp. TaxID=82 RepID=UPI002CC3655A|nr:Fic family protein [Hyphomicrobium sp.]HRN88219.1 Fic family protein [Hyphomicrobium sp.]
MADPTQTEFALSNWRHGQTFAERLSALLLYLDGYSGIDPQCPLGGPDGTKDIICSKDGKKWIAGAYFPSTSKTFSQIKTKFEDDLTGAIKNAAGGFVFFVNQRLSPTERVDLGAMANVPVEIYHVERMADLLNNPKGFGARLEYLRISMSLEEQVDFFSALNYDLTKRLIEQQGQLYDIHDKIDLLLARTATMHEDLLRERSSVSSPLPSFSMQTPTSQLSLSMLSWLHRIVTEDSGSGAMRGRLRSVQSWIASGANPDEVLYQPPPPEQVPVLLDELLKWWHQVYPTLAERQRDDVIDVLVEFHHRFLQIHPFLDGNGRLARVLLDQAAIELLEQHVGRELTADPAAYYAALRAADQGDRVPLRDLISATLR